MAATHDDGELFDRMLANMRSFFIAFARSASGGSLIELPGVIASVVPAAPDRSVFNSVLYEGPAALGAVLEELSARYEAAGVRAWTVWTPEADARARALLGRAGHVLDATPAAMALDLDGFEAEGARELDWSRDADIATVARLNDDSYGFRERSFGAALRPFPPGVTRIYAGRLDGSPASCLMTHDHDADCGIYFVATEPEARGQGLAGRLLGEALGEARARGCETSSLQATAMGEPVYARLGYRTLGRLNMWERRPASARGTPAAASR